jgi:hypothetical protein
VDDQLGVVVKEESDDLQESARLVESESQLLRRWAFVEGYAIRNSVPA